MFRVILEKQLKANKQKEKQTNHFRTACNENKASLSWSDDYFLRRYYLKALFVYSLISQGGDLVLVHI